MLEVGVIGKPNVGKSTLFSALTLSTVPIAAYPFTTIEPHRGVAVVRAKCPHPELGRVCTPRNSQCVDGTRLIPVSLLDVAGLVPGAHSGRGLGNRFLDDLRQADAFIHVVDASGSTDGDGRPCEPGTGDPIADIRAIQAEIDHWVAGILSRDWTRLVRHVRSLGENVEHVLTERLTGLRVRRPDVARILAEGGFPDDLQTWTDEHLLEFARGIRRGVKKMTIAANKADITSGEMLQRVVEAGGVPTSAECELALRRAAGKGLVRYTPGDGSFEISDADALTGAQASALERVRKVMARFGGTGVQRCIEKVVYEDMGMRVIYPVENENRWTDKQGNVLPDAHLVPSGCTAREFAGRIHSDLQDGFICAIDGRTKTRLGGDHVLQDGDVVKIVAR